MNERLTSRERIRKKRDFASIYRYGSRYRGRYYTLVYRPNALGCSRLGVVVSKKVGPAVTRNGVKRRMRELFRRNKGLFTESMDLIIVARPEIVDLGFAELEAGYFSALGALTRKRTPG